MGRERAEFHFKDGRSPSFIILLYSPEKGMGRMSSCGKRSNRCLLNTASMSLSRVTSILRTTQATERHAYFIEGGSAKLRRGNIRDGELTAKGFDTDRSFMLMEIVGDKLYFQTISRINETVDSGWLRREKQKEKRRLPHPDSKL